MTPHLYVGSDPQLPDDQELERLTEYVGGFMTDAEAEQFEERLMDDEDFFERMEPLLDEWYAPGVLPIELEIAQRLEADSGSRVVRLRRRLTGYRVHAAAIAIAAALVFAVIQARHGTVVAPPTHVAHTVAPSDTPAGARAPAPSAKQPSPRRRTSGHTRVASRAPVVVAIPGETIADRAVADSAMRAAGAMPSAQSTRQGAVIRSEIAPIPITMGETSSAASDSTTRNSAETARDKANPTKTGADEVVKRGLWQKLKAWVLRIPPKKLLTDGRTD
jgi:hypothetical protein